MLRRVLHDRRSVTEAAQQFGFSRTAFYQTQAIFEQQGLPGLIPKRPGPKEAHKLNPSVMEFLDQQLIRDDSLKAVDLAALVSRQFGLSVHPRSVERALSRRRKKGSRERSRGDVGAMLDRDFRTAIRTTAAARPRRSGTGGSAMGTESVADTRSRGLDSGRPIRTGRAFGATSHHIANISGGRDRATCGTGSATDGRRAGGDDFAALVVTRRQ